MKKNDKTNKQIVENHYSEGFRGTEFYWNGNNNDWKFADEKKNHDYYVRLLRNPRKTERHHFVVGTKWCLQFSQKLNSGQNPKWRMVM